MNLILLILSLFVKVFCLAKLWAWFAVPLGMPAVGMVHMLGLLVAYNLINYKSESKDNSDFAVDVAVYSLMALLTGCVLTLAL